jgi:hypothetical protein
VAAEERKQAEVQKRQQQALNASLAQVSLVFV